MSDFPVCRGEIARLHINKVTYVLVNIPKQWIYAKSHAEGLGGVLATVPNELVNDEMTKVLKERSIPMAWIGFTDATREGSWVWVSESEANYSKWDVGEPNNKDQDYRGEDHACLQSNGFWNDLMGYQCGYAIPFWVEYSYF